MNWLAQLFERTTNRLREIFRLKNVCPFFILFLFLFFLRFTVYILLFVMLVVRFISSSSWSREIIVEFVDVRLDGETWSNLSYS